MSSGNNFPVHDITDLKEKISKLKIIQEEKRIIRSKYEEEIKAKEEFLIKTRQEYTVLAPNAELRYHSSAITHAAGSIVGDERRMDDGEVSLNFDNSILDADFENGSRYRLWNDKLEMTALMEEMRLPTLEKDVKYHEKQTESYKKFLIKEEMKSFPSREPLARGSTRGRTKNDPLTAELKCVHDDDDQGGGNNGATRPEADEDFISLLLKSTEDLKATIEKTINVIIEDKVARKQNIEKLKIQNNSTLSSTTTLRKEIQSKLHEKVSIKTFLLQFENDHLLKKKRQDIVLNDFVMLRNECSEGGGANAPYLWQTAVFKEETGIYFFTFYPVAGFCSVFYRC
jgi:hypothetical protein